MANLGLALGLTALVSPVAIGWKDLRLHWWVMMGATMAFMLFVQDLTLTRTEGLMFLAGAAMYLGGQILATRRTQSSEDPMVAELLEEAGDATRSYPVVGLDGSGLWGCTLVRKLLCMVRRSVLPDLGVSTHVVGVTVVALAQAYLKSQLH